MKEDKIRDLLNEYDSKYAALCKITEEFNKVQGEFKSLFLSIPVDLRIKFIRKGNKTIFDHCNFCRVELQKLGDKYTIHVADAWDGELDWFTRGDIPEDELIEFLTNTETWAKKEQERLEKIKQEEEEKRQKDIEKKEREEYNRLKAKFES